MVFVLQAGRFTNFSQKRESGEENETEHQLYEQDKKSQRETKQGEIKQEIKQEINQEIKQKKVLVFLIWEKMFTLSEMNGQFGNQIIQNTKKGTHE